MLLNHLLINQSINTQWYVFIFLFGIIHPETWSLKPESKVVPFHVYLSLFKITTDWTNRSTLVVLVPPNPACWLVVHWSTSGGSIGRQFVDLFSKVSMWKLGYKWKRRPCGRPYSMIKAYLNGDGLVLQRVMKTNFSVWSLGISSPSQVTSSSLIYE